MLADLLLFVSVLTSSSRLVIVLSAIGLPILLQFPSLDFLFFLISSSISLSGERKTFDFF